ncbi:hypothetical protein EVAR_20879_1 [Eumeta japonica]|uniref:Uncharacterized protein n=1 Tax=Eumeta variegata TaxID=151549 RepID=A0A4C1UVG2_EUMVA|nr:hypothetical protein EVAR_20879_1 [Eumeta japonica]
MPLKRLRPRRAGGVREVTTRPGAARRSGQKVAQESNLEIIGECGWSGARDSCLPAPVLPSRPPSPAGESASEGSRGCARATVTLYSDTPFVVWLKTHHHSTLHRHSHCGLGRAAVNGHSRQVATTQHTRDRQLGRAMTEQSEFARLQRARRLRRRRAPPPRRALASRAVPSRILMEL